MLAKYGVRPASIPDRLALVGDSADGYPGLSAWGPKSASSVLSRYEHLEAIAEDSSQWELGTARAVRLAESLRVDQEDVLLYRRLATLQHDVPLQETTSDLEWRGAHQRLQQLCGELGSDTLSKRVPRWIP